MTNPTAINLTADIQPQGDGRRLRVAHVSLTLKTGGLERILADFARLHDRSSYEMEFIALRQTGRFADEIRSQGCPVHALNSKNRWSDVRQLRALFSERGIDVVHTHNTYPHLYATVAARLAGVPVVLQTRHGQRAGHGLKSRLLYRAATQLADRVVAVSDDAAGLCLNVDRLPAAKVQRIWNGIDADQFSWQQPASAPHAISVARLSAEKDFPTLLRAVAIVREAVPAFRLTIVGDGAERASLEDLTKSLGITDSVCFAGEQANVPRFLAESAFFVTSTLTEGISLTLLEAMAVGRAIVATAVGGNPEVVDAGKTGLLVPPASPHELADALLAMCRQPQRWEEWGRAGRDRVLTHFTANRMVADYERLYDDLFRAKQETARRTTRESALSSATL